MKTTKSAISLAILFIFVFNNLLAQVKTTTTTEGHSESLEVSKKEGKKGGNVETTYNVGKGELRQMNKLFIRSASGETILNPKQFSQITSDKDLEGVRVYAKKDGKFYKYLGNQDVLIALMNSPELRPVQCEPLICGERICDNGTVGCICINEWCLCMMCSGSNMSDL
jgi:hypothetical protein